MKTRNNNTLFIILIIIIALTFGLYIYFDRMDKSKLLDLEQYYNYKLPYTVQHIPENPPQQIATRTGQKSLYEFPPHLVGKSLDPLNPGNERTNNLNYYPNYQLPAPVIGCGGRRGACMGGSEIPIPNTLPPVDISSQNIAPVTVAVRGYDDGIQQVGVISKLFGKNNDVLPLYGRRLYRDDNKWEYFAKVGPYGVTVPVVPIRNWEELNTNDRVFLQGQKGEYRVTIYDSDVPQYLPYY